MSYFCVYCGSKFRDSDIRCSSCGAPFSEHSFNKISFDTLRSVFSKSKEITLSDDYDIPSVYHRGGIRL